MSANVDVRIVVTSPRDAFLRGDAAPFEHDSPEELAWIVLFRELEQRTEFLQGLRAAAAATARIEGDHNEYIAQCRTECLDLRAGGDAAGSFEAGIRWWAAETGKGYHAYSLKTAVTPYRSSCCISLDTLDEDEIRAGLASALEVVEADKERVLEMFGLAGFDESGAAQ